MGLRGSWDCDTLTGTNVNRIHMSQLLLMTGFHTFKNIICLVVVFHVSHSFFTLTITFVIQ